MKKIYTMLLALITLGLYGQTDTIAFNDLKLEPDTFWNGSDGSGSFTSGILKFPNDYNRDWAIWSGWSYSNKYDTVTPGFTNQYSAYAADAGTFALGYISNNMITGEQEPLPLTFTDGKPHILKGIYVSNTTYTALDMKTGSAFSKKFGGDSGKDADYLLLKVFGKFNGGVTDTVEFFLADYRAVFAKDDYIVNDFSFIDLRRLGRVDSLFFMMQSTDVGAYGMNTPAYFAMNKVVLVDETPTGSDLIAEVIEYTPAPGQLINTPLGVPEAAHKLVGSLTNTVSLGAFGGYLVFRFEKPVVNHPDHPFGVDFTIFGNAMQDWAEPGIVYVMRDTNGNGIPDETWYELAGSDYFFSTTHKNSRISYSNPAKPEAADVPWTLEENGKFAEGLVKAVEFKTQPYYPLPENFTTVHDEFMTYTGSRLGNPNMLNTGETVKLYQRGFGYADNYMRGYVSTGIPSNPYTSASGGQGGDGFDINWAVDSSGNYVKLDTIDFIKVQTAVLGNAGMLGEISTEISGARATVPAANPSPTTDHLIVINDIPRVIDNRDFPVEAAYFINGIYQPGAEFTWSTNLANTQVDGNGVLHIGVGGEMTLTASLKSNSNIKATTLALVTSPTSDGNLPVSYLQLYPNPATDFVQVNGGRILRVQLFDSSGRHVKESTSDRLFVGDLKPGMYLLRVQLEKGWTTLKFIKK